MVIAGSKKTKVKGPKITGTIKIYKDKDGEEAGYVLRMKINKIDTKINFKFEDYESKEEAEKAAIKLRKKHSIAKSKSKTQNKINGVSFSLVYSILNMIIKYFIIMNYFLFFYPSNIRFIII